MFGKKSLSQIIVVLLLILITISSISIYEYKTKNLIDKLRGDVINHNPFVEPKILGVKDDKIYIRNRADKNITVERIEVGRVDCGISQELGVGLNEIDIINCKEGNTGWQEILVQTENFLVAKDLFVEEVMCDELPDAKFCYGRGTLRNPYLISTCVHLQNMNSSLSSHFALFNDVDCSDTKNWNSGDGFKPIGNSTNQFYGSFNGEDFKISNLYINGSNKFNLGLFGYAPNIEVSNVKLINFYVNGAKNVGGLVGCCDAILNNIYAIGNVSGADSVGGLAGSGSVYNSYANVNIFYRNDLYSVSGLSGHTGGFVGYGGDIINSSIVGNIYGNRYVGGLVGETNGLVSNSSVIANVSGINAQIGGLVGFGNPTILDSYVVGDIGDNVGGSGDIGGIIGLTWTPIISRTYFKGNVGGGYLVGGIIGELGGNGGKISDSYVIGDIKASGSGGSSDQVSGLVATGFSHTIDIENSYFVGNLTGTYLSVFLSNGTCLVESSYYDNSSALIENDICGDIGKTTNQLQAPITNTGIYESWSSTTWNFGSSSEYPKLYFE